MATTVRWHARRTADGLAGLRTGFVSRRNRQGGIENPQTRDERTCQNHVGFGMRTTRYALGLVCLGVFGACNGDNGRGGHPRGGTGGAPSGAGAGGARSAGAAGSHAGSGGSSGSGVQAGAGTGSGATGGTAGSSAGHHDGGNAGSSAGHHDGGNAGVTLVAGTGGAPPVAGNTNHVDAGG